MTLESAGETTATVRRPRTAMVSAAPSGLDAHGILPALAAEFSAPRAAAESRKPLSGWGMPGSWTIPGDQIPAPPC